MYNVKSMQASEFIAHDEILETLAYASATKIMRRLSTALLLKQRNARDFHTAKLPCF